MEIGPGHDPFPVTDGATVTYADKSSEAGRDQTWPELVGAPHGPEADVEVDLDAGGLRSFADASFDAIVASHILEHLADPIAAILEIDRVLRLGGLAAIVMPDRHRTFDRVRQPTTLAHLLDENDRGIVVVDDEHIRGFCEAIWEQEPIHPEPVRSWHDPSALDPARYDLHRRRTVHVHCWSADEFVVLLAGLVAGGLGWELIDQFVADDAEPASIEFGVLLRRTALAGKPLRWRCSSAGLGGSWAVGPNAEASWRIWPERSPATSAAGPELYRLRPAFPWTCSRRRPLTSNVRWPRLRGRSPTVASAARNWTLRWLPSERAPRGKPDGWSSGPPRSCAAERRRDARTIPNQLAEMA